MMNDELVVGSAVVSRFAPVLSFKLNERFFTQNLELITRNYSTPLAPSPYLL